MRSSRAGFLADACGGKLTGDPEYLVRDINTVTDAEIIAAQKMLGRKEGVGVEPASAASVAGAKKLREMGIIGKDERVVCICTGNALKDPDTIIQNSDPVFKCANDIEAVKKILLG